MKADRGMIEGGWMEELRDGGGGAERWITAVGRQRHMKHEV